MNQVQSDLHRFFEFIGKSNMPEIMEAAEKFIDEQRQVVVDTDYSFAIRVAANVAMKLVRDALHIAVELQNPEAKSYLLRVIGHHLGTHNHKAAAERGLREEAREILDEYDELMSDEDSRRWDVIEGEHGKYVEDEDGNISAFEIPLDR